MRKRIIIPFMLLLAALFSNAAYAGHWSALSGSQTQMHIAGTLKIDGADAQVNDEVAVFDSTGTLIGSFVVDTVGQYGDIPINGDVSATPAVDEGAQAGETLAIKVWRAGTSREYGGSEITLAGANLGGPYLAATIPLTFTGSSFFGVTITATATPKTAQTIGTISFTPSTVTIGGTTTVSATATSGLPVSFTSTTTSVCTVSGATVTALTTGTCTIAANQAGNGTYNAATQVTGNITPSKQNQTIGSLSFAPTTVSVNGTTTVSATATSGLGVTFTSTTTGVCTVSGTTVTALTTGTCTIAADQAGNGTYNAAPQATGSITPGKGSQTIGSLSFAPTTVNVGGATTVSATATSGLGVTFSSATPSVCTVSGATVTALTTGTCTIAADQAGNGNYNAALQVTGAISPSKQNQTIGTISFTPTSVSVNGTTTVSATATSGLAVIFSSTTPSVCTVSGVAVTALTTGTCTIAANQAGNGTYNAATQVTGSITPSLLTLSIGAPSSTTVKSGATVTYTVTYTGADTVTLITGNVTVNKTGTANGTAAVSGSGATTRTVTISDITGDGTLGISIAAGTASASGGAITASASAASATFIVDNSAPTLVVTTLANNVTTSNNTLTITGTANDANGVATVTVNGSAVTVTAGTFNTAVTLISGANTITVVATDTAGNQKSDTRTITYDNTVPIITLAAPTPTDQSFTNQQAATITGTVSKPGSVVVTVGAGNPITLTTSGANNSFTTPVTLALGSNTISIKASDTASPPNSATVQRIITYDATAPVLAINDPAVAITTTFGSYLVKGTLSDNFNGATLSITLEGVAVTPAPTVGADGTFQQSVSFTEGKTYHLIATATDKAGNSTTVQRNIVYQPFTISDALRALQIASGIDTADQADLQKLDVGPLNSGKPAKDGAIDLSDAIVLLRLVVGDLDGIVW